MKQRLAIITTHPIQYYAPIFQLLHAGGRIDVRVFYTAGQSENRYDHDFGREIEWDLPLLSGYPYQWVGNTAKEPGSHHFNGVVTPGLPREVTGWYPDAILIIGWAYRSHLFAMRYFYNRIPVLFRGDSTLLDERGGFRTLLKKTYLRWVYRHIDRAFYNGQQNKAYFIANGVNADKLVFAPHAIDVERFRCQKKAKSTQLREELKIGDSEMLILFAGKFIPKKNPLLLLRAFQRLSRPGLHLLFAGNGVLEAELRATSANDSNVHFIGLQNQSIMPVLYQAADLFCLPSSGPGESWGLSVNEAMAAGKPVLVSDKAGCAADLVDNWVNGCIFASESLDSLLTAMDGLTSDKERLHSMGNRSYEIIRAWNFLSVARAIEDTVLNFKKK